MTQPEVEILTANSLPPRRRGTRPPERVTANKPGLTRRQEILEIAARCFVEYGFEATSIRQISDVAKILSGSLYHHFDTKEQMLHELMSEFTANLRRENLRLATQSADTETIIASMISFTLGELTEKRTLHGILYNERKYFRRNSEFRYVAETGAYIGQLWHSLIFEGVRTGIFRELGDVSLVTSFILRMLNTTADWYRPGGNYELRDVINQQIGFILRAIRADSRIAEPLPLLE